MQAGRGGGNAFSDDVDSQMATENDTAGCVQEGGGEIFLFLLQMGILVLFRGGGGEREMPRQ